MSKLNPLSRRNFVLGALSSLAAPAFGQSKPKKIRMLLNTGASGPQAWFYLAQDRGYLADEGLDVVFTPGYGAYTAAPRLLNNDFDIGYGDINSLIEVSAAHPQDAPVGVFAMFNSSPSTIAVRANGPIQTPKDLEGKTLVGHSSDVALRTFAAFCESTGVDRSKVTIGNFGGGFRSELNRMLAGNSIDGIFGYVSTISAAMKSDSSDENQQLRHLTYAEYAPDLYGSAILATRRMLRDDPETVEALVRAFNKGLRDTVAEPDAAIDAVMHRAKHSSRSSQELRLQTTLNIEMGNAEGKHIGIGAIDHDRLQRSIDLIADTNGLSRKPALQDVCDKRFLPPLSERVRSL